MREAQVEEMAVVFVDQERCGSRLVLVDGFAQCALHLSVLSCVGVGRGQALNRMRRAST